MNSNDPYRPKDLARHRKELSDIKNNTSELTFGNNNNDSRAAAYKSVREMTDDSFIEALSEQTDESEMLAEFELMERMKG